MLQKQYLRCGPRRKKEANNMPNLRSMIDGTSFYAAGIAPPIASPPPGNAGQPKSKLPQPGNKPTPVGKSSGKNGKQANSPAAQHVLDHLSDPMGATKEGFQQLTNAKLQYDQQRENMQRELAMPQSVINHLSQIHGIMPGQPAGQMPTPGMTPGQQPGQIDPATGQPMGMDPNDPNNPGQNDDPDMDPMTGNPGNMSQTPGQMNQSRPSIAGHQPGVAPGPAQNVVPGKMGMPKPGAQSMQHGKQAAPPKGNKSLPGAKGPGDPKVANKTKKAQGQSSRAIKINVAASANNAIPVIHARGTIESTFGLATLLSAGTSSGAKKNWSTRNKGHLSKREKQEHYKTMDANIGFQRPGQAGAGMRSPGSVGMGNHGGPTGPAPVRKMFAKKKIKAGPAQLSDKVSDSGAQMSYNPTGGVPANTKLEAKGKVIKMCGTCGKMHAGNCN